MGSTKRAAGLQGGPAADEEVSSQPKRVKAKKIAPAAKPEDLVPGTVVIYWESLRGVVRDTFEAIDEYWLNDEENGELVRDEDGNIVQFKSGELLVVAKPPIAQPRPQTFGGPAGGVLILGTEEHMMTILKHFGAPDYTQRCVPQQLLALPCSMCEPNTLLQVANEGVEPEMWDLASKLRPDIHLALRAYHLKNAVERLGSSFLRLEQYFCLASISMPFGQDNIEESANKWERHWRSQVCNQIDLGITVSSWFPDEPSATGAQRRALGEFCGMTVSEGLWAPEVQKGIRRKHGVPDLGLGYKDVNETTVTALMLPEDAVISTTNNLLIFAGAEGVDYATLEAPSALAKPGGLEDSPQRSKVSEGSVAGKTVAEWEKEQEKYAHLPKLPPHWLRVTSRSSGDVYFYNKRTKESTFEMPDAPLPDGWTKQTSKSTGKTYYFHAKKKLSVFERPTS